MHGISRTNLLDLGIVIQMRRPFRLASRRCVQSISMISDDKLEVAGTTAGTKASAGEPKLRRLYIRAPEGPLRRTISWDQFEPGFAAGSGEPFLSKLEGQIERIGGIPNERASID